jgi:hypothetical protein
MLQISRIIQGANMAKVVAIHQPNFLPWIGYFHKMSQADVFVLLDNVQFSKGSYANRVKIKARSGQEVWLTIPVHLSRGSKQLYNEIGIAYDHKWPARQSNLLQHSYHEAPFFDRYFDDLVAILTVRHSNLASLNITLIRYLKEELGIQTRLKVASELGQSLGDKSVRLLNICQLLEADTYLSGQGARAYNDEMLFTSHGVKLIYHQFACPVYPQLHRDFVANLSIVDLLFNHGPESRMILERA